MGGQTTNTTTSGLSNPQMQAAASTIGTQLNNQLNAGVRPYTGSLAPDLSSATMAGVNALSANPNNGVYGTGISNALAQQANIATGNVQDDPVRQRALQDALDASNSVFTASGRFGSGSHATNLGEGATNALASLDYSRQQQALQNLPSLYQASMLPASSQLQAGQILDAQALAKAQDAERLFDVQNNAGWNTLQRGSSIFSGTAPVSGTTTTQTSPSTPWWQSLAGGAIGLGSLFF